MQVKKSWNEVVNAWRESQKCQVVKGPNGKSVRYKGLPGECCAFHRWQLFGPILKPAERGVIITSPEAEAAIKANMSRRDGAGYFTVCTARGKRRIAKKENK
jgi:hypothetical protein